MDFGNNPTQEGVSYGTPVLQVPIEESLLNNLINQAIATSQSKEGEIQLSERRTRNRQFWKGNHVNASKLDTSFQSPHVDNVVYQDEESRITLASSRIPDLIVVPPKDDSEQIERARKVKKALRNRLDSNTIKRLIKDGLRLHDLDLISVIKVRHDQNRDGGRGDFVFELLDTQSVGFSATSRIIHDGYTAEGVDMMWHWNEEDTQTVLNKFPAKAQQIKMMWGLDQMPTKLRYLEIHFSWIDQSGQKIEGVAWKFQNIILASQKTPYFDYDGVPFLNPESQRVELKKRNHFKQPRKPFIIMSYQNLLEWVYDSTTPFEQGTRINAIINRRLRQITEISDRTIPKLLFSANAFKSGEAEKYVAKMNNPLEHVVMNGEFEDIRKAVMVVQGAAPDRVLYQDLAALRGRIDSLFNTHGTTRGDVNAGESGVSRQIAREGDLAITDDIVDFIVERVVAEMANWALHMMKLYYNVPRTVKNVNSDEDIEFTEISSEDIDDDVEVIVRASTNDPQIRRSDATAAANGKLTDPFSFMEDMDMPLPKERTKRLITWLRGSQDGYRQYLKMLDIDDEMFDAAAQARADIQELMEGNLPSMAQLPTSEYIDEIVKFMKSPQYTNADPEIQQVTQEHIAKMKEIVNNHIQNEQQNPQPGGVPTAPSPQGQPTA